MNNRSWFDEQMAFIWLDPTAPDTASAVIGYEAYEAILRLAEEIEPELGQ